MISNYIYIFTCHVYVNSPDTGSKQLPHRWKCCDNTSAANMKNCCGFHGFHCFQATDCPKWGRHALPILVFEVTHGTSDHHPNDPHLVEATSMARGIGHTDRRASHKISKRNTKHVKNMLESDHDQQYQISGK